MNTILTRRLQNILLFVAMLMYGVSVSVMVYAKQPATQSEASQKVILAAQEQLPKGTISGIPTRIVVPSVNIDLTVDPGVYDAQTDEWTLSGYNAQFATLLAPANNNSGNTFIYGHNNKYVFGPLKDLPFGSQVEIYTDTGSKFIYTHQASKTVEPSDTSLLSYTGPPILTIQTCTGVWHEKRGLYEFKLTEVIESQASLDNRIMAERAEVIQMVATPLNPIKIGQWL